MVISSIDLKDGKVVQLKNGKDKVLERTNADQIINEFNKYGETAVIDLDAALGNIQTDEKGKSSTVNTELLNLSVNSGYIPVVSSIAIAFLFIF